MQKAKDEVSIELKQADGQELVPAFKTDLEAAQFYAGSNKFIQATAKRLPPRLCKQCGIYPAENGGICQPCLDYREHTAI